nr:cysteine rich secretory protein 2 [Hymenolepis microstoma]CDS35092.2 cysteine rich secretory protein 2 [Hymenolepis microstoma]
MYVFVITVLIAWPCLGTEIADESSVIVNTHNDIRSNVQPPAADMLKMSYDSNLEKDAQQLIESCDFDDKKAADRNANFVSGQKTDTTWANVIKMWGGEKYDYESNACSTAQTKANDDSCKHYIQVVWSKAMKVGCAKKECPNPSGSTPSKTDPTVLMLCLYDQGSKGKVEKPYTKGDGDSCKQCPPEYPVCENKLCIADTSVQTTTSSTTCISSPGMLATMALIILNHFN